MCDCAALVGAKLAEKNARLVCSLDLYTGKSGGVIVATEKLNSKKRGGLIRLVASHCPFCGVKVGNAPTEETA